MLVLPDQELNSSKFMCGVVEGFYGRPWTFDQRKRLFQRMNKMGMDTYLYAPKDDCKHRMYWRDLYTVEEADHLTTLIEAAEEQDIIFVYALSPGLDMTYSSPKELTCLKRKLEQVASFGCKAFALLFDDIDVDMCETDKEIFQSFAQAQVSVTNEVFQHLNQPESFLFCPTEYCATRAVPNVAASEYLTTIGAKLLSGIDVMWTGPMVVSKKISIKSIEELAKVLQRPPVIWDNIHANDYDQRRLFLGPYEGRSSELIPYIRGVLTNPNCEFEANFIAMHTLAQWSKSNASGKKKDFILSESPVTADIKLETEGEYITDEDVPIHSLSSYQPKIALNEAIKDWMEIFYNECSPDTRKLTLVAPPINMPVMSTSTAVETCSSVTNMCSALQKDMNNELNDAYVQPVTINLVNSLVDASSESEDDSVLDCIPEPMDCASSTSGASTCSAALSADNNQDSVIDSSDKSTLTNSNESPSVTNKVPTVNSTSCEMPVETMQVDSEALPTDFQNVPNPAENHNIISSIPPSPFTTGPSFDDAECSSLTSPTLTSSSDLDERLTEEDILNFVELFYMPFEHGNKSVNALNDFHLLKTSAICLCNSQGKQATPEQKTAAEEWQLKAEDFCARLKHLTQILTKFGAIPNKALLYDLFPYIWDMMVVLNQLHTFISWLAVGRLPMSAVTQLQQGSPYSWSSLYFRQHFSSGDQEPWVFRGGVQAEFQRMLPLEGAADLLLLASPPVPIITLHKIRPYKHTDEAAVYEVCRRTCDDGVDGTEIFPDQPDLIGDKLVGGYLNTCPEHCFVIENAKGVVGYILAAPSAQEYYCRQELAWLPAMRLKYPKPSKDDDLSPAEEIIASFHHPVPPPPPALFTAHPALIRMDILPEHADDPTCIKRGLASTVAALKISGAQGLHTEIHVGDHNTADLYAKLGFIDLPLPDTPDNVLYMGRMI